MEKLKTIALLALFAAVFFGGVGWAIEAACAALGF